MRSALGRFMTEPPRLPCPEQSWIGDFLIEFRTDLKCRAPERHGLGLGRSLCFSNAPPRFKLLLHASGEASRISIVVNTPFNGFINLIVWRPRDAVRVIFSTGMDNLGLDQFVIRK